MDWLIFAPAALCVAAIFWWGTTRALLNVCLPVLLLLPTYFYWKVDGFPGLDFSAAVFFPLGLALIPLLASRWKFSRSDLWLLLYILSSVVADLRFGGASLAKYRMFNVVAAALLPYMAGKLLIEQAGARFEAVQRITMVLCLSCVLAIPEFFIKLNLFSRIGMHLFPNQWPGWWTQVRWGFGRVAGPFGTAEIYGLVLLTALLLLIWRHKWTALDSPSTWKGFASSKKAGLLLLFLLTITLVMTQSRGPWLGVLLALPVALVGRATRIKRAGFILILALIAVAIPAYTAGEQYLRGPRQQYGTEKETAQYRRDLVVNYLPIAEKGGLWGWGTFHPVLNHQQSIDNEFLRIFLVQGLVGLVAYMLLICEAAYRLLRLGIAAAVPQDRQFCFTLLGIFAGWAVTLSTVYMGAQSYQLFFLLVGWTQAIVVSKKAAAPAPLMLSHEVEQELPLTRVYT